MGEFTQNLLKLTEFPFSYSFIGLLALIFGQGTNLEDLSFAKIGPLLILMSFVATTLSICDPVGALQRVIIKSPIVIIKRYRIKSRSYRDAHLISILNDGIFDKPILYHFSPPYFFAIRYSPKELIIKNQINSKLILEWIRSGQWWGIVGTSKGLRLDIPEALIDIDSFFFSMLDQRNLLEGLKQQTVKTKWITAEIDKITALIYFIVTISAFIVAIVIVPGLLHKFSQVFQDIELVRRGVLIFSALALSAVSIMLILRILGLFDKASTVFKYLTALEAIKVDKEKFRTNFEDVEGYLNEGNWVLAEHSVEQIQEEYTKLFLSEISINDESNTGGIPSYTR